MSFKGGFLTGQSISRRAGGGGGFGGAAVSIGSVTAAVITARAGGALETSYDNDGGKGDRTAMIVISVDIGALSSGTLVHPYGGNKGKLINGSLAIDNDAGVIYFGATWDDDDALRFDLGDGSGGTLGAKKIDQMTWYQHASSDHGCWTWQGSNNASDWTAVSSRFFLNANTATLGTRPYTAVIDFDLIGDADTYRYYQMSYGPESGCATTGRPSNTWLTEIEFKISA